MLARFLLAAALVAGLSSAVQAQGVDVVPSCGAGSGAQMRLGSAGRLVVTPDGTQCTAGSTVAMPSTVAEGGLATYRVSSPNGVAAQAVKAAPGRIYSYNLCNNATAARYVRFYNATSATTGTTPIFAGAIIVAAGTCQQFTTNFGLTFSAGISMSVTAASGDADTTSAALGDVSGFIGFM